MATAAPYFNVQFITPEGVVAAGFQLDTFDNGTTTPKGTFTNAAETVSNANPIILDAEGRCNLFLGTGSYTLRLRQPVALGSGIVRTWNDVTGISAGTSGSFLPLAGGVTMTGRYNLAGPAISSLQPVTLQQQTDAIAAAVAPLGTSGALNALTARVTTAEGEIDTLQADVIALRGVPGNTTAGGVDGQVTNVNANFALDVTTWPEGRVRGFQNTSSSNITLTPTGTLRLNGTTSTGARTILPFGLASLRAYATGQVVISGGVT